MSIANLGGIVLAALKEEAGRVEQEEVGDAMRLAQDLFVEAAPVASGYFRSELVAYTGSAPDGTRAKEDSPFYPPPGHDQVDAVLAARRPGEEAGFVDNVPYAQKLADGHSPQAPAGWVDRIETEVQRSIGS